MINKTTEAFDNKIKLNDDKVERLGETMIKNVAESFNKCIKELDDLEVALDDFDTGHWARTDTLQKSLEVLDVKINNNQQGPLGNL